MAVANAGGSIDHGVAEQTEVWLREPGREALDPDTAGGSDFASPTFGPARTRIRVETRHLAFLDGLAARVRVENNGRLSRAELFAILVRVLLSAGIDPEKVRSESALVSLLHERTGLSPEASDE